MYCGLRNCVKEPYDVLTSPETMIRLGTDEQQKSRRHRLTQAYLENSVKCACMYEVNQTCYKNISQSEDC